VIEAPDTGHLARWVHRILLTGVLAAGLLLAIGLVVVVAAGNPRPIGPPAPVQSMPARLGAGDGVAMIELGLLVLVLTPCMRVVVLAVGWGIAGDRRDAVVAAIVLGLLGLSVWLGLG
jgi:hypothetical protein